MLRMARRGLVFVSFVVIAVFFLLLLFGNNTNTNDNNNHNFIVNQNQDVLKTVHHNKIVNQNQNVVKTVYRNDDDVITSENLVNVNTTSSGPVLRVLVLTYKRGESLSRCLKSLDDAVYDGQKVEIEIHIDRGKDEKVNEEIVKIADRFKFRHGPVRVHVQPRHVGVLGQWLGTWKVPRDSSSEIAVFVEDDVSVSPYFARWLRLVHKKYDGYPGVNGYTLQTDSIVHSTKGGSKKLKGPPGELAYAYPVLGSWGFSPNVRHWRDFMSWYHNVSSKPKYLPFVPGLLPSQWYRTLAKNGRADSMWTMWHIAHAYENKLYTVYPNPPNKEAFAFNWKEPGEHYSKAETGKGLRANVVSTWRDEDFRLPETLTLLNDNGENTGKKMTPKGVI